MNYLFLCMKRSGQHGVVNWFAQQNTVDSLHYNNCIQGWDSRRLLPMKEHMVVHYKYNGETHDIKNYFVDHKIDFAESERLRKAHGSADFSTVENRLYNIEDISIKEYNQNEMWLFDEMKENSKTFVILRDPYNFIASCLQRLKNPPDPGATDVGVQLPQRLTVWKEHARQALYATESNQEIHFINFNEWFLSEDYRRSLCEKHDLVFTDRGINKVMNFGNGSSFDREQFDGNAQQMKVIERYKDWQSHSAFRHLIDDEIEKFAKDIFGMST